MCSEQQWDKQYQITNQYLDRFSRKLYFVALEVGVSVLLNTQFRTIKPHIHGGGNQNSGTKNLQIFKTKSQVKSKLGQILLYCRYNRKQHCEYSG